MSDEQRKAIADQFGGPKKKRNGQLREDLKEFFQFMGEIPGEIGSALGSLFRRRNYSGVETLANENTLDSGATLLNPEPNTGAGRNDNILGDSGTAENNPPVKHPETGETLEHGDPRYWDAVRLSGAGQKITGALAGATENTDPSGATIISGEEGTVMRTRDADSGQRSLYIGGNEGELPNLSFGKVAHEGFYDDHPQWVTDNAHYEETLKALGTVKRRPDSELTSESAGDRAIQEILSTLGYEVEVDGYWGPQTDAAIQQFKNDNGLGDSATLDHTTREALKTTMRELRGEER